MAWTFEGTHKGYGNHWREAVIRPEDYAETTAAANKIIANEQRYKQIQAVTRVPWFWIGAIHNRENSNRFDGHLHNGDPLTGYTTHVPANRPQIGHGPPFTWEESAIDVLQWKNLDEVKDWPVERMLLEAEIYNGLGYTYRGINSPYVWAATSKQERGKFTDDGKFDPSVWDTQLGVAAILKRLAEMRPDIAAALVAVPRPNGPVIEGEIITPGTAGGTVAPAFDFNKLLPIMLFMLMGQQKPAAPGQPDIMALLFQQMLGGQPLPALPPPVTLPKTETPVSPTGLWTKADKNGMGLGTLGLIISALLQYNGVIGTPFDTGVAPSTTGTIATGASIISMLGGAGGGIGLITSLLPSVLGLFGLTRTTPSK